MAAIVRLDSGIYENNIANIKFATALENGTVVTLGALGTDGTYTATAPADVTKNVILLHSSVPMMYETEKSRESDFSLAIGKVGRAYYLKQGDIVTITDDGINGTTVLNQYVIPANGATKMVPAANLTGATTIAFKVLKKTETLEGKAATVLEVVVA